LDAPGSRKANFKLNMSKIATVQGLIIIQQQWLPAQFTVQWLCKSLEGEQKFAEQIWPYKYES
jgi:hypothetical protein